MVSTSPQPTVWTLRTLLCASGSPGRSAGSCTSGRAGREGSASVTTAGSSSYSTRTRAAASSAASFVSAATAATGSPWYFTSSDGEHRAIVELRPEARHRLGQVGGGHDEVDARHGHGGRSVDADDARVGDRQRHELDVQLPGQVDVGHVALPTGDPRVAADAVGRSADARPRHGRRLPGRGTDGRDRSARSSRSDRGCRPGPPRSGIAVRVRDAAQQVVGGHDLARDAEAALHAALVEEGLLQPAQDPPGARPSTVVTSPPSASTASTRHGVHDPTIEPHGAGAALADQAAFLGAGQLEVVAQDVEERVVRRHLEAAGTTVDGDRDGQSAVHVAGPSARRAMAVSRARPARTRSMAERYSGLARIEVAEGRGRREETLQQLPRDRRQAQRGPPAPRCRPRPGRAAGPSSRRRCASSRPSSTAQQRVTDARSWPRRRVRRTWVAPTWRSGRGSSMALTSSPSAERRVARADEEVVEARGGARRRARR